MRPDRSPDYLAGYPLELALQVRQLIDQKQLAGILLRKYPAAHTVRTDRALYGYVQELKAMFLRNAGPLGLVAFDGRLHVEQNALGTHTTRSRVQGTRLKSKREIRVAAVFKEVPLAFLRMIVVHELAHIKEPQHDKAFYQLCRYMEPDYHQLEFDLRAYLSYLGLAERPLWAAADDVCHGEERKIFHPTE